MGSSAGGISFVWVARMGYGAAVGAPTGAITGCELSVLHLGFPGVTCATGGSLVGAVSGAVLAVAVASQGAAIQPHPWAGSTAAALMVALLVCGAAVWDAELRGAEGLDEVAVLTIGCVLVPVAGWLLVLAWGVARGRRFAGWAAVVTFSLLAVTGLSAVAAACTDGLRSRELAPPAALAAGSLAVVLLLALPGGRRRGEDVAETE